MMNVIFFPASPTPVRKTPLMNHSPTWHYAMQQAAYCRTMAHEAGDFGPARRKAIAMSAFFIDQARRVRQRDRYLVGAI